MEGSRRTTQKMVITGIEGIYAAGDFFRTIVAGAVVDDHFEDWVDLC
jgi:hypothetical protein